jgi:hypothetical protein
MGPPHARGLASGLEESVQVLPPPALGRFAPLRPSVVRTRDECSLDYLRPDLSSLRIQLPGQAQVLRDTQGLH